MDCDGTAFATAAKQLAADTGANLVIDPRLADKANKTITLKLEDVPLETAVRLMAEVADLGTVRMSNVLFVTTTERAEKLRPSSDGPTQPNNNGVIPFPIGPDRPVPLPGIIGPGGIGMGVPGVVLPAMPVEVPKTEPAPAPDKKPDPEKKPEPPAGGTTAPATGTPAPPPPPVQIPPAPAGGTTPAAPPIPVGPPPVPPPLPPAPGR